MAEGFRVPENDAEQNGHRACDRNEQKADGSCVWCKQADVRDGYSAKNVSFEVRNIIMKIIDITRKLFAAAGWLVVVGMTGTSDYYSVVLGMKDPDYVWPGIIIGLVMMAPELIHLGAKRKNKPDPRRLGVIRFDPDAGEWICVRDGEMEDK